MSGEMAFVPVIYNDYVGDVHWRAHPLRGGRRFQQWNRRPILMHATTANMKVRRLVRTTRFCAYSECRKQLPDNLRAHALYCPGGRCKKKAQRETVERIRDLDAPAYQELRVLELARKRTLLYVALCGLRTPDSSPHVFDADAQAIRLRIRGHTDELQEAHEDRRQANVPVIYNGYVGDGEGNEGFTHVQGAGRAQRQPGARSAPSNTKCGGRATKTRLVEPSAHRWVSRSGEGLAPAARAGAIRSCDASRRKRKSNRQ